MKLSFTLSTVALGAAFLAACASTDGGTSPPVAARPAPEYRTGSNIPVRDPEAKKHGAADAAAPAATPPAPAQPGR